MVTVTRSTVLAGAAVLDEGDITVVAPDTLEERLIYVIGVRRLPVGQECSIDLVVVISCIYLACLCDHMQFSKHVYKPFLRRP